MAGFDAERYLRLAGERWLREGGSEGPPWNPVLSATGAALVAMGAMTTEAARAVIRDYHRAAVSGVRDRQRLTRRAARPAASPPAGIGRLRVVPCGREIDRPWGRLAIDYVAFTEHATTLQVTLQPGQPPDHSWASPPIPVAARRLRVTDDRETAGTAEFFGSHRLGEPIWHGQYEIHPQLATDTAWIELLSERVELTGGPAGVEVWMEPVADQDPARRHLWDRVATLNDFHDPHLGLETTIATLVAAGALPADDPATANARAVLTALRPTGVTPAERPAGLPQPWRSLVTRWGQIGGPVGTVTVGAITPPFDGISAAVVALESRDEHFAIGVELVPGVHNGLPYRDLPDQQHLTWWAADDRGNHYLGEPGSWHSDDDRCGGTIGFWPALDPRATRIDLMPTATSARAVIRVPLPGTQRN